MDITRERTTIVVIGAGQAGLSAGYFLRKRGLEPGSGFVILDHAPKAGGAWQHRWPSLTLQTANAVHDLPGLPLDHSQPEVQASTTVPGYYARYEREFGLDVRRPADVREVARDGSGFLVRADIGEFSCAGVLNATGTWEKPFWPRYPGAGLFEGRQLHAHDYRLPEEFAGQHVLVVGAGVSGVQLLLELSKVARTTWATRREPLFREGPFTPDIGRAAVAVVEDRVRRGLPPGSVVSVTGLMWTPELREAQSHGVLARSPMFQRLTPTGVAWADGRTLDVDAILWCTGFRANLDHLAPLRLRSPGGGIVMTGRLATRVAAEPRLHLLGYGPSASTIGANRAGRAAVAELMEVIEATS
ncbi:MAG: NAD(P)-binding domain-containing protein [Segniliparus sp.]|uniref:NAD(P)-binding domain-containing protein n=1 Tax=Segniliparus sp. TaxID=2804064 RepID=UPI003F2D562C